MFNNVHKKIYAIWKKKQYVVLTCTKIVYFFVLSRKTVN